jgi:hypothetical protein
MTRRFTVIYVASLLAGGLFILIYRGPFWEVVRGYGGDWLIVQLIYVLLRLRVPSRFRFHLAAGIFSFGALVEGFQYFYAASIPNSLAADLTVGRTFDPLDIAVYLIGLITALLIDHYSAKLRA